MDRDERGRKKLLIPVLLGNHQKNKTNKMGVGTKVILALV